MRVVLDTNVLVAALRSPRGASAKVLLAALDQRIELVANVALFAEYEAVLTRPEHLAAAGASPVDVLDFLDDLSSFVRPAERNFSWRPQLADADDEMVLEPPSTGRRMSS